MEQFENLKTKQVGVLGIPLDENSSFLRGPAQAPAKIREAFHSDSSNYFTESGIDLKNPEGWKDEGDMVFTLDTPAVIQITENVKRIVAKQMRPFLLGGDHSITFPIVEGLYEKHGPLTILHLDAHPDLYDDFDGNPHSHASPFARIMERGLAKRSSLYFKVFVATTVEDRYMISIIRPISFRRPIVSCSISTCSKPASTRMSSMVSRESTNN